MLHCIIEQKGYVGGEFILCKSSFEDKMFKEKLIATQFLQTLIEFTFVY